MERAMFLEGVIFIFPYNNMICDLYSHSLRYVDQQGGRRKICRRRSDIVGRMIVHEDDRIRVVDESFAEDFPRMDDRFVKRSFEKNFVGNDFSFRI